jgi:hypothetical protein
VSRPGNPHLRLEETRGPWVFPVEFVTLVKGERGTWMAVDADEKRIDREKIGTPTTVKSGSHDGWASGRLMLI